ncbi:MAG TPA: DNA-binding domain-containing protein [Burkholderiales bacterium]|nr:DNA-binding domain-containing protein [Burkholderiales bacterium]
MPSLPELQAAFERAMIGRDERPLADSIVSGRGLDAQARIDVYRNNVLENYRAALREVYPVVLALVGEPFFQTAAAAYAERYPSQSGDLNDFGAEFGDFLARWPPAAQHAYLPDVARLEWATERCFHAADAAPLDLRALAAVPQDVLPTLRFELHPASRIVCSPYPILRIWEVNQPGFSGDQSVDLRAGGDAVLVIRRGETVELERLSAGERALLQAIAADRPLAQAYAQAEEAEPGLDLAALLRRHVLGRTLVAFRHDKGATT